MALHYPKASVQHECHLSVQRMQVEEQASDKTFNDKVAQAEAWNDCIEVQSCSDLDLLMLR